MFRNIQVEPCEFFGSAGINEDILRKSMDRMEEVPFDSDRKLMSTKYSLNGVSTMAFAAGVCNSDCTDYRTELYTDSDYPTDKGMPQ